MHLCFESTIGYATTVRLLLQAGANPALPNLAGLTALHAVAGMLAADLFAHMISAALTDIQPFINPLLAEVMRWGNGSYGNRHMHCVDALLAASQTCSSAANTQLKSLFLSQQSTIIEDYTWRGDTLLPLQGLARRVLRRQLAYGWIKSGAPGCLSDSLRRGAQSLPIPDFLQAYIGSAIPSPLHKPGSSFRKGECSLLVYLGPSGTEYRVKKALCKHYNSPATCQYGSCGGRFEEAGSRAL